MTSSKKYVKFLSSGYFFPSYISPLKTTERTKIGIDEVTKTNTPDDFVILNQA